MLDFDFISKRKRPSVAGMIYPFGGDHVQRFYFGTKEIVLPVYSSAIRACERHTDVDWIINFSSCRSVYESCVEIMEKLPQIKNLAVIAEGVPERLAKRLRDLSKAKSINIIGPATGTLTFVCSG
jgi:ATP citrate (pro-S)-lyase